MAAFDEGRREAADQHGLARSASTSMGERGGGGGDLSRKAGLLEKLRLTVRVTDLEGRRSIS